MDLRCRRRGGEEGLKFFSSTAERLAEIVALQVKYDTPDEHGETRRQRNARFGQESPQPEEVEGGEHLLDAFWALDRLRTYGFSGPDPLQPGVIRDWCALTGEVLDRAEIQMLLDMDTAFLNAWYREAEARRPKEGGTPQK
jgi:hypothetical protein